jgi:gamma-glutamyltranspeptidase/glutathione hydrolase
MLEHRVQNWNVRKPLARSRQGLVASQNQVAARAGAQILAEGGNAVDAAVATGFALAAVEPWNSGLGGIGYMLVYLAREQRVRVVNFSPISPRALDPADYPLTSGFTTDLFTWPSVLEDRNVHGPRSIAVPGHVAGMGTALETFGSKSLAEVMAPAIDLADRGMPVDWYLTLKIATMARELARYESTRSVYLPGGFPPATAAGAKLEYLQLTGLADTLRTLSQQGWRDFYEGETGRAIAADVKALGGSLNPEDLRSYRATLVDPLELDYRNARFALAPGLTAGPSFARALKALSDSLAPGSRLDGAAFVAYADVLRDAYRDRLQTMGDTADARDPSSTTHFNVVDRAGNMVAVTQTLLSVFGSKLVLPRTGILMNNGIMWFDPRPGSPNSLAPNKRPLTNMCPIIVRRGGQPWFAIGASGGRKIFPAVFQISSFLIDHGMSLEDAFHQPRIDASGGDTVGVDPRLATEIKAALAQKFPLVETELVVYPTNFACPSSVLRDPGSREFHGMTDVLSPWSGAAEA